MGPPLVQLVQAQEASMAEVQTVDHSKESADSPPGQPLTIKAFDTKAESEAWARLMESEMDRGIFVSRAAAERYTLNECLDRYIEEYIPRMKHAKREVDCARALQRRTLAHRVSFYFPAGSLNADVRSFRAN